MQIYGHTKVLVMICMTCRCGDRDWRDAVKSALNARPRLVLPLGWVIASNAYGLQYLLCGYLVDRPAPTESLVRTGILVRWTQRQTKRGLIEAFVSSRKRGAR